MVWIKIDDTRYLNSDLITSLYIPENQVCGNEVYVACNCGEFTGDSYPDQIELCSVSFESKVVPNSIGEMIHKGRSGMFAQMSSSLDHKEEDENDAGTYNDKMYEKINENAKKMLSKLIIELEVARKNGDAIFDLKEFIKPYNIED